MVNLLFFEEYESNLSHKLFARKDIHPVIIRTTKNLKFFSKEYLEKTNNMDVYTIDYDKSIKDEADKFKKWLNNKNIKLDYFLNDSEYYLEFSNKFARCLGLESLTDEQIGWVRDKCKMKRKFNDIGIDTVKYLPINSKQELKQYFLENNSKKIIFKPRSGMNSINTYIIESLKDIEDLEIDIKPDKYMVEEFCYDKEWSIESIVQNGIVLDSYLTFIPNPTLWASISNNLNCHMTMPKVPNYFKFNPKDFIQKIVDGMNLKNGAMTIEVFVSKEGKIKASELGWRLPGCQATLNHSLSYGIDIYDILLDIAIGKKVNLKYNDKIVSVGDLYLPNKEGIITEVTSMDELLKMDGVINGESFVKVGDYQIKRRVGNDASGWVQVVGKDENETLEKMQYVYDNYNIKTDREEVKKNVKKRI